MNSVMPDHQPDLSNEEDEIPWDCDGGDEDLGNYDELEDIGDED